MFNGKECALPGAVSYDSVDPDNSNILVECDLNSQTLVSFVPGVTLLNVQVGYYTGPLGTKIGWPSPDQMSRMRLKEFN